MKPPPYWFYGYDIKSIYIEALVRGKRIPVQHSKNVGKGRESDWYIAIPRDAVGDDGEVRFLLHDYMGNRIGARTVKAQDGPVEVDWFMELDEHGNYGKRRITAQNFILIADDLADRYATAREERRDKVRERLVTIGGFTKDQIDAVVEKTL